MLSRFALVLLLANVAVAQILTVSQNPMAPGTSGTVTWTNNTSGPLAYFNADPILIHPDGERIVPRVPCPGIFFQLPSGQSVSASFSVPVSGAGSSGSYVLYAFGWGLRLDVGTPASGFPALCAFPRNIDRLNTWSIDFDPNAVNEWRFVNTSNASHTFGPSDRVRILSVNGNVPLRTSSLNGLTADPGRGIPFTLPHFGLPRGPYVVEVAWIDPAVGPVVRRMGINKSEGDLHLPGGRTVPLGGSLEAYFTSRTTTPQAQTPHSYALMVGSLGGQTGLPGAASVPLVLADPLVMASLDSSLFGLLHNNVGLSVAIPSPFSPTPAFYLADAITISHPNGLSGMTFRVAAVAYGSPAGPFRASQPQEITLQ